MILEGVEIRVEKTDRRKTVSIIIERDGSVRVLAPTSADDDKIQEAVQSKQYQIFSKLAQWKALNQGKVKREFVNGQSYLYLGRNYKLDLVDNQEVPLKLSGGYFRLDRKHHEKADQIFKAFFKEKAEQKIIERLKLISEKFTLKPSSVKVMDLQNRWASWTPKNGLIFHWKCAMAPISVLDYIITHEMVHLEYPNHSQEFWNELDKKMPNFREKEEWLKRNGVKMDL